VKGETGERIRKKEEGERDVEREGE